MSRSCIYCRDSFSKAIDESDDFYHRKRVVRIIKGRMQITYCGTVHNFDINFCPMCGKKLPKTRKSHYEQNIINKLTRILEEWKNNL